MRRLEYRWKGVLVATVDVGLHGWAILRWPDGSRIEGMNESDCRAVASAAVEQAKLGGGR